MGKMIFDISTSLDGYITASNKTADEPMGQGGERLHEWAFGQDERNQEFMRNAVESLGAVICGRVTYDDSIRWWGPDGPTGPARRPVFVVTHEAPDDSPEGGVYTFVTGGIEAAVEEAKRAAGDDDVTVMGGASLGQQYIAAGLVDEISIHLVPVLFHGGTRLFDNLGGEHTQLEPVEVIETDSATHMRFRVVT
jgi:dihydrofolate reductase